MFPQTKNTVVHLSQKLFLQSISLIRVHYKEEKMKHYSGETPHTPPRPSDQSQHPQGRDRLAPRTPWDRKRGLSITWFSRQNCVPSTESWLDIRRTQMRATLQNDWHSSEAEKLPQTRRDLGDTATTRWVGFGSRSWNRRRMLGESCTITPAALGHPWVLTPGLRKMLMSGEAGWSVRGNFKSKIISS